MRFPGFSNNWTLCNLSDVSGHLEYGIGASAINFNGKHRYIRITDISNWGKNEIKSPSFIEKSAMLNEGDILLARTGATVGDSFIYKDDGVESYFAGFLIRAKVQKANPYFVYYQLKTQKYAQWVKISSARSGQPGINSEQFGSYIICITEHNEQQKIANFLKAIDERIETQNKIIEDLKIFRNLIYDKLVNFYKTEQISIKDLINRDFVRMVKSSELKPFVGVKKYLSTSSIDEEGISSIESLITYKERPSRASMYPINQSVWFAKMKNSIKVLKSNNEIQNSYVLSTGFYGLLCDERKISSDWLLETFRSNSFNNQKDRFSEGSSMSAIKDNQLEDILINLIINKADEEKAVKLLLSLSSSIVTNKSLLEKYKKQKEYLLTNMFI